jgi:hypothetical protein
MPFKIKYSINVHFKEMENNISWVHTLIQCAASAVDGHDYSIVKTDILSELKVSMNFGSQICYCDV